MTALQAMGTAQNRKVYARHGAPENQFGVSFANLNKLSRRIKTDHALARQLWATGNADARILATRIADPAQVTAKELNAWVAGITHYVLADAFAPLVFASRFGRSRMEAWLKSRDEFRSTVAWNLVARFAANSDDLDEAFYVGRVRAVEEQVAAARNRTRHAMALAMICIGLRSPLLERLVLAASKRIGRIEVDHGETGCQTPGIAAYIAKTKAYRAGKKARTK